MADIQSNETPLTWIGQLWNDISGKSAANTIAYERQVEMAKNQYKYAVEGMKEAGLNPAMMYQTGANGTQVPTTPNAGSVGYDIIGGISTLMNSITNAVKAKEIDSKVADAMYQRAEAMTKNAQTNANYYHLHQRKYIDRGY